MYFNIHRKQEIVTDTDKQLQGQQDQTFFFNSILRPTNAQLFHKLSHSSYTFRHYCVILSELVINTLPFLFFKLSPCSICNLFLFGQFPGVWVLIADVSELTVGSIFIGRWMKYVSGWILWGINTPQNPSTDILHSPAYEDGTDSEFRNVGN